MILKLMSRTARFTAGNLMSLSRMLYQAPQERRVRPWFRVDGDNTLRLQYDLVRESVVFDVGGYRGEWAAKIHAMYGCVIHVFEAMPAFADDLEMRFRRNPRIKIHKFGLADKTYVARLAVDADASSIFQHGETDVEAQLVDVTKFIADEQIQRIDLMKINIEGGEYALLERLINTGMVRAIANIQVQFHDFVENAGARMQAIQCRLGDTHDLTYQYPFVWENWRLRSGDVDGRFEATVPLSQP